MKFDKWVTSQLKTRSNFRHSLVPIHVIVEVNQSILDKDDFYEPTKSQAFKNYVSRSLAGPDNKERIDISKLPTHISDISAELNRLSDIPALFEHRSQAYRDYYRLLAFSGNKEQAKEYYTKSINESKNRIALQLQEEPEEAKKSIQSLERFSEECKILLGLEIKVEFDRSFRKIECKQRRVKLASNLGYEEILSFDTSLLNIESFAVNDEGAVCAVIDRNKIILIQDSGEITEIGTLEYPDSFRTDVRGFQVRWDIEADSFLINNYILKRTDLVELPIQGIGKKVKVHSLYPFVSDLVFDKTEKLYYALFTTDRTKSYLSVYTENGDLSYTSEIEGNCRKINLKRKEILRLNKDNSYESLDFKGNPINRYPFGNGNDRIALSNEGNEIVLHFYSTKSQFYNLEKNKKQTLWAHPTFVKGYKQKFYANINHNFGMITCKFSPNNKILVGGADHGKYVLWDGSGNNRKELIPSEESRIIFNYFQTKFKDGQTIKEYFVPYVESIDSKEFFINRGYSTNQIVFIDDNVFLTKVKDAILTWDYEGNSIGYVYGLERCVFSETNYMALHQDNQLSILRRKSEFDENFKSSIFKEIEKNEFDSNISNIPVSEKQMEESSEIPKIKNPIIEDKIERKTEQKQSWFSKIFKRKST